MGTQHDVGRLIPHKMLLACRDVVSCAGADEKGGLSGSVTVVPLAYPEDRYKVHLTVAIILVELGN